MSREQIGAEGARLKRCKPRRCPCEGDVGDGFALKHLTNEDEFPAFLAVADAVADHALRKRGREFRREVTHLVGVGKQNQIRLRRDDDLLQRDAVAIWRIGLEQIVLDFQYFRDILCRQLLGKRRDAFADDQPSHGARCVSGNLLRRCQRFETGVVPLPLPLLSDDQNFHFFSQTSKRKRDSSLRSESRSFSLAFTGRLLPPLKSRALRISVFPPASPLL